jgi:hypothetical protein
VRSRSRTGAAVPFTGARLGAEDGRPMVVFYLSD